MQLVAQQILIGLTNGLLFALIALGYSLVYSVLGLVNFAHGEVFMLSGLLGLVAMHAVPEPWWHTGACPAVLVAIAALCAAFGALLNVALDRFLYRPARDVGALAPLVTALGTSLVLQNVGLLLGACPLAAFGYGSAAAAPKSFPQPLSAANLLPPAMGLHLSLRELVCAGSVLVALMGLVWLVGHTSLGRAMRAYHEDPLAARLMGIAAEGTVAATFALAGALAGLAAVVYGLFVGTVHFQMGGQTGLFAFAAAVTGGLGSIGGAVLGALLLGLLRAGCDLWLGSQWQPVVVFGCLLLLLVVRPQGLFGRGPQKV